MRNDAGDGIYCDYCNFKQSDDFIYYSFDFTNVHNINGSHHKDDIIQLSSDLCYKCMKLYEDRVKQIYQAPIPGVIRCDITGHQLSGEQYDYYRLSISKVTISLDGAEYKCDGCGEVVSIKDKPCKCGASIAKATASVDVDENFIDLFICDSAYNEFCNQLEFARNIGADEWTKI